MVNQDYLNVCNTIKSFSHDFQTRFGFNHVWFFRYYFNGDLVGYGQDQTWNQTALENNWHSGFAQDVMPALSNSNKSTRLHWSGESYDCPDVLKAIRCHDSSLSGFNYLRLRRDHIESIGFGTLMSSRTLNTTLNHNSSEINLFVLQCLALNNDLPQIKLKNTIVKIDTPALINRPHNNTIIPLTLFNKSTSITSRQAQTLVHLAQGKGYKTAAADLGISTKTIEYHVGEIRRIHDGVSLAQLVTEFHQSGTYDLLKMVFDRH